MRVEIWDSGRVPRPKPTAGFRGFAVSGLFGFDPWCHRALHIPKNIRATRRAQFEGRLGAGFGILLLQFFLSFRFCSIPSSPSSRFWAAFTAIGAGCLKSAFDLVENVVSQSRIGPVLSSSHYLHSFRLFAPSRRLRRAEKAQALAEAKQQREEEEQKRRKPEKTTWQIFWFCRCSRGSFPVSSSVPRALFACKSQSTTFVIQGEGGGAGM